MLNNIDLARMVIKDLQQSHPETWWKSQAVQRIKSLHADLAPDIPGHNPTAPTTLQTRAAAVESAQQQLDSLIAAEQRAANMAQEASKLFQLRLQELSGIKEEMGIAADALQTALIDLTTAQAGSTESGSTPSNTTGAGQKRKLEELQEQAGKRLRQARAAATRPPPEVSENGSIKMQLTEEDVATASTLQGVSALAETKGSEYAHAAAAEAVSRASPIPSRTQIAPASGSEAIDAVVPQEGATGAGH
eukprot:7108551-Karenia_brevis.AAC.1